MNEKAHILLVNREEEFLESVGRSLRDAGYSVLTATTMSHALDVLSGRNVLLVICDSELPDSSGFDFLGLLKDSPALKKIPFMFLVSARFIVDTLEEEVARILKAFDMGAADFIVDTPEEEISGVLMKRIGKILPADAGKTSVPLPDRKPLQEERAGPSEAVTPGGDDRRDSERTAPKKVVHVEISRDAVLWMPGQIININEQGLKIETSLLGKLDMLLFIRVPFPGGKKVVATSHIRHISISNHQFSAVIGVEVEESVECREIYNYVVKLMGLVASPEEKAAAPDAAPVEKIFDANMIKLMDGDKRQTVHMRPPLNDSSDTRNEKSLEMKFYRSLIGKQLGNYKAMSFIGAGSMAGVFKGWDFVLEREVALKIISYKLSAIASCRDMFVREARLVSRLTHPNIAKIYHIDHMDDILYFAMEFISGGTLADIINQGNNVNLAKGLEHFITICQTLDFVSRQNIIHRDIKPENILIDDQGMIRVVDFGVAIVYDGTNKNSAPETMAGSPLYVSPECVAGRPLDSRSDIYSLGATFYHFFAGVPPFDGDSVEAIFFKHVKEVLVPLKKRNPAVSGDLSYVIGKMMAKRPDDRFQNYQVIIDKLSRLTH
ncbi:MAG: protein kinase [Deltaproteobacteria bacterium]